MSEEPKNSAAPPSKEPITKAALEALGHKVLPPAKFTRASLEARGFKVPDDPPGTGFMVVPVGGPVRPKSP